MDADAVLMGTISTWIIIPEFTLIVSCKSRVEIWPALLQNDNSLLTSVFLFASTLNFISIFFLSAVFCLWLMFLKSMEKTDFKIHTVMEQFKRHVFPFSVLKITVQKERISLELVDVCLFVCLFVAGPLCPMLRLLMFSNFHFFTLWFSLNRFACSTTEASVTMASVVITMNMKLHIHKGYIWGTGDSSQSVSGRSHYFFQPHLLRTLRRRGVPHGVPTEVVAKDGGGIHGFSLQKHLGAQGQATGLYISLPCIAECLRFFVTILMKVSKNCNLCIHQYDNKSHHRPNSGL